MLNLTRSVAGVLAATGLIAFLIGGGSSFTALIPTVVGLLLWVCAEVAARRPDLHKHALHAALGIALLAALGSLMQVAKIGQLLSGDAERPLAIIVSLIMLLVCIYYLAAGVRSFRQARNA